MQMARYLLNVQMSGNKQIVKCHFKGNLQFPFKHLKYLQLSETEEKLKTLLQNASITHTKKSRI